MLQARIGWMGFQLVQALGLQKGRTPACEQQA